VGDGEAIAGDDESDSDNEDDSVESIKIIKPSRKTNIKRTRKPYNNDDVKRIKKADANDDKKAADVKSNCILS